MSKRVSPWIPISKRLPPIGDEIILCTHVHNKHPDQRWVAEMTFVGGKWEFFNKGEGAVRYEHNGTHVVAWMPVPEPYDGDE